MIDGLLKKFEKEGEIYLRIKARPGASNTEIVGIMEDDTVKINVGAQPVGGKANRELIKFLAKKFGTNTDDVKIISGSSDKIKLIKIKI